MSACITDGELENEIVSAIEMFEQASPQGDLVLRVELGSRLVNGTRVSLPVRANSLKPTTGDSRSKKPDF